MNAYLVRINLAVSLGIILCINIRCTIIKDSNVPREDAPTNSDIIVLEPSKTSSSLDDNYSSIFMDESSSSLWNDTSTLNLMSSSSFDFDPYWETSGIFLDTRDGHHYTWKRINKQVWMTENLNYSGHDSNGNSLDGIGNCFESSQNPDVDYCELYGRYYDWYTALDVPISKRGEMLWPDTSYYTGLCPKGWHIPNKYEVIELADYVINQISDLTSMRIGGATRWPHVGSALKDAATWMDTVKSENNFEFSFQPNGACGGGSVYCSNKVPRNFDALFGSLWTRTETTRGAFMYQAQSYDDTLYLVGDHYSVELPIRCILD
jgi:uncharacterized protein (TIGR02145 family)